MRGADGKAPARKVIKAPLAEDAKAEAAPAQEDAKAEDAKAEGGAQPAPGKRNQDARNDAHAGNPDGPAQPEP
jgi:hypothetical protein